MTSRIRHRRGGPPPPLIEPGELSVDTANRQLTAGDIAPAAGVPLPLLAIRFFDTRTTYAVNDFVVHGANILRANAAVTPGPFNAAQWTVVAG